MHVGKTGNFRWIDILDKGRTSINILYGLIWGNHNTAEYTHLMWSMNPEYTAYYLVASGRYNNLSDYEINQAIRTYIKSCNVLAYDNYFGAIRAGHIANRKHNVITDVSPKMAAALAEMESVSQLKEYIEVDGYLDSVILHANLIGNSKLLFDLFECGCICDRTYGSFYDMACQFGNYRFAMVMLKSGYKPESTDMLDKNNKLIWSLKDKVEHIISTTDDDSIGNSNDDVTGDISTNGSISGNIDGDTEGEKESLIWTWERYLAMFAVVGIGLFVISRFGIRN